MNWKGRLANWLFDVLNSIIPKNEWAVVLCPQKVEDNGVVMANYLVKNKILPVTLIVPKDKINFVRAKSEPGLNVLSLSFLTSYRLARARYWFLTDTVKLGNRKNKKQIFINIWHGVGHKKLPFTDSQFEVHQADFTIATSPMTRTMFADLFGVPEETVIITGLPRNDQMLESRKNRKELIRQHLKDWKKFSRVVIWMPTFRRRAGAAVGGGGITEVENCMNFPGFDLTRFTELLEENNTLCIIKSHPMFKHIKTPISHSHILEINEDWLEEKDLFLYELLACTDALITDYSSVMIDYSLLDQPIFCVAEDLEDFKKGQGLYFEDFENWVPTKFFTEQNGFFSALEKYLKDDVDLYKEKRGKIRDTYFEFLDDKSSLRIINKISMP